VAFIHVIEDESSTVLAELVTTHDCYELPDQSKCFVHTIAAWCHGCGRFTLVEKLVSPEELEASAREFYEHRERHPLLPRDIFPAERDHQVNLSVLNGLLHEAAQWRLALATRKSPPRCLECGGTNFVPLPETEDWSVHPADPTERVRERTTCHASMCEPGRLYDAEGRRIAGRQASWHKGRPQ
jgi:hypothetical protein